MKTVYYFCIGLNIEKFRFESFAKSLEKAEMENYRENFLSGELADQYKSVFVYPVLDDIDPLPRLNAPLIELEQRANAINKILDVIDQYVPIYKRFFDENFKSFVYKTDGALNKKWSDKIQALPRPDNIHRFYINSHRGYIDISVWGGSGVGYIEETVYVYDGYNDKVIDNPCAYALKRCSGYDLYLLKEQIKDRETKIQQLHTELSFLKLSGRF